MIAIVGTERTNIRLVSTVVKTVLCKIILVYHNIIVTYNLLSSLASVRYPNCKIFEISSSFIVDVWRFIYTFCSKYAICNMDIR